MRVVQNGDDLKVTAVFPAAGWSYTIAIAETTAEVHEVKVTFTGPTGVLQFEAEVKSGVVVATVTAE